MSMTKIFLNVRFLFFVRRRRRFLLFFYTAVIAVINVLRLIEEVLSDLSGCRRLYGTEIHD